MYPPAQRRVSKWVWQKRVQPPEAAQKALALSAKCAAQSAKAGAKPAPPLLEEQQRNTEEPLMRMLKQMGREGGEAVLTDLEATSSFSKDTKNAVQSQWTTWYMPRISYRVKLVW